ncbi:MAG: hypothetical protein AAGI23_05170 [Bacteroidota bacterium]
MRQSRLVKRLEKLGNKERERFIRFVQSPYFNQHENTTRLLDLLMLAIEKGQDRYFQKEHLFKKLFPGEAYDEQQVYNVMTYLLRLYHRFLAHERMENQAYEESIMTLEEAYTNSQLDVFTNRAKYFEKQLQQQPTYDTQYYYTLFRYRTLWRDYTVNHVKRSDQKSGAQLLRSLDEFYILEKLRQCCLLRAHEMIMNTQYDFSMLSAVLDYVDKHWARFQHMPTIAAYYTVWQMLEESEEATHYQRLKALLLKHTDDYTFDTLNELYDFASNYCILKVNSGNRDFQKELFDIYKQSIKNETVLRNGKIDGWDYKNISTLGCHLEEFNWTYHFIETYKEKLLQTHQTNAYNYSLAYYHLSREDYDQARTLLLEVQFTEVQYHLGGNLLLMRSYYALDDIEALLSLLESMRIYIMRSKKMTVKEKRGYKNMLRFTKKLVQLKTDQMVMRTAEFTAKVEKLRDDIETNENVYAKSWILQQCKILLQGTAQKRMRM